MDSLSILMRKLFEPQPNITSLIDAAFWGRLDVVKDLIAKGADIHAENDQALCNAAEGGHLEIVKYLVSNGADVHAENDQVLRDAVKYGRLDVVQYFKERQIDKQNVVYVSKQYNLTVGIQQLILSYM